MSRRVAFNAIAIDISINFQLKTILITHNAQCTVDRGCVGSGRVLVRGDKGSICGWRCGVWRICQARIMARWAISWDQLATLQRKLTVVVNWEYINNSVIYAVSCSAF